MEQLGKLLTDNYQLEKPEVNLVLEHHNISTINTGDFFIANGRPCRYSGFLLNGVMRCFEYDKDGNDPTCYFFYPAHYILDPFTYYQQTPSSINAQAVTDCEMAIMSFDEEKKLIAQFPRWVEISRDILLKMTLELSNQKAMLALNATERYEYFMAHYPIVAKHAPLKYVASYLGIAQPSLSRIRKSITSSHYLAADT